MNKDNESSVNILLESLIRPFKKVWEYKSRTILWVIYILLGGLLGVAINLINRCMFGDFSFQEAIYAESVSGTFYTYSIVMISATIGPLFFNLSEAKVLHFADIKSFTITVCIFVMFFAAIFYSNCVSDISGQIANSKGKEFSIDWPQIIFFVLAIACALYSLGLEYMEKNPEGNSDIDSAAKYQEDETKSVNGLKNSDPKKVDDIKL